MTETEFIAHSEALFTHIEDSLDDYDFDCTRAGNVLTIEADDGTQIIVNRHTPNQELWIAAKSGGYHFAERNGQWLATPYTQSCFPAKQDFFRICVHYLHRQI